MEIRWCLCSLCHWVKHHCPDHYFSSVGSIYEPSVFGSTHADDSVVNPVHSLLSYLHRESCKLCYGEALLWDSRKTLLSENRNLVCPYALGLVGCSMAQESHKAPPAPDEEDLAEQRRRAGEYQEDFSVRLSFEARLLADFQGSTC